MGVLNSKGFLLGAGAVVVYRFLPAIIKAVRPLAVEAARMGYKIAEEGKVIVAQAKEAMEDVAAEAKAGAEKERGHTHKHK